MVIHGSKMMYLEDKSVNNHPTQIVNHHCLDRWSAPTIDTSQCRGHPPVVTRHYGKNRVTSTIRDDLFDR